MNEPHNGRTEAPDCPLLTFGNGHDWTLKDSFSGAAVLGATGSGKTSAVGKTLATQFLRNGFGALVLAVKPEEISLWENYCRLTNRTKDLIIFKEGGEHRFNFIDYEARLQQGKGTGLAVNIADIVMKLSDVSGSKGQQNDAFWEGEQKKMLINPIETIILAGDELTPQSITEMVMSSPNSEEELESEKWRAESACFQSLLKIRKRIREGELNPDQIHNYRLVETYWLKEHARLHQKTKGIVQAMFTSFFSEFDRGANHRLFCTDTIITPEACLEGKIVLMNLPTRDYGKAGLVAQKLMKLMFQRTAERSTPHLERTPALLWADEFQKFYFDYDIDFQATARSSGIATVYLTQNLPNATVVAGGDSVAETKIKALLGNLTTKFFLANDCPVTNKYAAELIGQSKGIVKSRNVSTGQGSSHSFGEQDNFEYQVRPEEFHRLKTGGKKNGLLVDAYMTQTGATFGDERETALKVTFSQKF